MYTTWTDLPAIRAAMCPLGAERRDPKGGQRRDRKHRGGIDYGGKIYGDWQRSAGRTSIGQETDGGNGRTIKNQASWSGREKLGGGGATD